VLRPYVGDEIPEGDLDTIVREATTFDVPLVDVGDRKVLEVFHGPTGAFKDVAAQYLGRFLSYFYRQTGRRSLVLVMTSGDTGGAVAAGLGGMEGVDVLLGYPKGRVSQLQQEQLRRVDDNIHTLEIDGSFDDCLSLVDAAFEDEELQEGINLTTANTINIGRLLPQITYHARIFAELGDQAADTWNVVPTGNGGDLMAGLFGRAMGVPSAGYVMATNRNDMLAEYWRTGMYEPKRSVRTPSNAMDIGNPKNGPRLRWIFGNDMGLMHSVLRARSVSDEETFRTIREVHDETGYVLDPHTAVGWAASGPGDVIVSTASPEKFAEVIEKCTGIPVDNSAQLAELRRVPERYTEMPNSIEAYKEHIRTLRDLVAA
jgi:threonine synthase